MQRSGQYAELAGSLATVAIASLAGPVSALGAGLAAVAKYAQAKYLAGASTRDLHRLVTSSIEAWANSEHIDSHKVQLGITLATRVIASAGLTTEQIASLGFDVERISQKVLVAARTGDRLWGTEEHYAVAEAAVAETYGVLIPQIKSDPGVVIPVLQSLRASIEASAAQTTLASCGLGMSLDALMEALISAASVAEVMLYLRTRIKDWDVSVWHQYRNAPSGLEQRLRVRSSRNGKEVRELTAAGALANQQMLVVLGGPGSGKSWLARRYAREAAQLALGKLEADGDLDAVELPVLTTWDQWIEGQGQATPVELRTSLVAASFASELGNSDLGGGDITARLQRTLTSRGVRVLVIVDSLDEAAEHSSRRETGRLRALVSLQDWRVVITSRPAAWEAVGGGLDRAGGPLVVELQDLVYPDDVHAFTEAWFVDDPVRGRELIGQIHNRHELQRSAVVPLILTFYCLLAEQNAGGVDLLPTRRRELYKDVIERLLSGEWAGNAPGPDPAADVEDCEDLLIQWAWHAVHNWTTPVGLGNWGDLFEQPARPRQPPGLARAIDHVAPKSGEKTARVVRRFVHRTVLEHFVAEHIVTLNAKDAADVLLPHLWFDPDWEIAAPAAISAHNQRLPGALLQQLLTRGVLQNSEDPARQAASREFDRLLLAVAEESESNDWITEHQDIFDACRIRNATAEPDLMAGTAHWKRSNPQVRTAMLEAVTQTKPNSISRLIGALPALMTTESERLEARTALLEALPDAHPLMVRALANSLPALVTTDAERTEALTSLLAALPHADPQKFLPLMETLPALVTTVPQRAEARAALTVALPHADPLTVRALVETLSALQPTDSERAEARTALLAALLQADKSSVSYLVTALCALQPTGPERAEARTAVVAALHHESLFFDVSSLVEALSALVTTSPEQAEARTALLGALPHAIPTEVPTLMRALSTLDPTGPERAEARSTILAALPRADLWTVNFLVAQLTVLEPTGPERADARTALLGALHPANSPKFTALVTALSALEPTDNERAEARTALVDALPRANQWDVRDLVKHLLTLEPTDSEQTEARTALLATLPDADLRTVRDLVEDLSVLEPTAAERAETRTALLATLRHANRDSLPALAEALSALEPTDNERAEARTALLHAIPWGGPDLGHVLKALSALHPTGPERARALSAILTALPDAESEWLLSLVEALPALVRTRPERAQARTAFLAALYHAQLDLIPALVGTLSAIVTTGPERAETLTALLASIPHENFWAVTAFVTVLSALVTTESERAVASTALLAALPHADANAVPDLVREARKVSSIGQWMQWLTTSV